jgi:hypothetical protein
MDNLAEAIASFNENTLKAIGSFQEQVLSFNREIAAAWSRVELPSWLPTPEVPQSDVKVDDLVKQAYDFQAQRVAADKKFALDLVNIWAPTTAAPRKPASASTAAK